MLIKVLSMLIPRNSPHPLLLSFHYSYRIFNNKKKIYISLSDCVPGNIKVPDL
uniref:Uncharacterized protein n=1 Tax=Octopus bimaculoides TaxID=37653 RepID=A0A0L8IB05_OCTBM